MLSLFPPSRTRAPSARSLVSQIRSQVPESRVNRFRIPNSRRNPYFHVLAPSNNSQISHFDGSPFFASRKRTTHDAPSKIKPILLPPAQSAQPPSHSLRASLPTCLHAYHKIKPTTPTPKPLSQRRIRAFGFATPHFFNQTKPPPPLLSPLPHFPTAQSPAQSAQHPLRHSSFDILSSFVLRHSSLPPSPCNPAIPAHNGSHIGQDARCSNAHGGACMATRPTLLSVLFTAALFFIGGQIRAEELPPQVENSKFQFSGQINANAVLIRSGPSDNYYITTKLD